MAGGSLIVRQFSARGLGERALVKFQETKDEWYLWSAYATYRGAGLPVPETIMLWLDYRASEACARRARFRP